MAAPVDEEGRRARNVAQVGAVDVLGDATGAGVLVEIVRELVEVETELAGAWPIKIVRSERVLMVEREVACISQNLSCAAAASAASAASSAFGCTSFSGRCRQT